MKVFLEEWRASGSHVSVTAEIAPDNHIIAAHCERLIELERQERRWERRQERLNELERRRQTAWMMKS